MKIRDILTYIETFAPLSVGEEWDNSGLLIGSCKQEVTKVLLALDITKEVVIEAHEKGCELIISHHPVIFDPLRAISFDSVCAELIRQHIAALCLHTNLDRAKDGVNTALANSLGLHHTTLYPEHFLAVGELSAPLSSDQFALYVKERLRAPDVRFTDSGHPIRTVAVSSGGGGEGIELSDSYRFDAFVTGELKHHQYLYSKEHGICAVDAGHFSTEDVVIEPLKNRLSEHFSDILFEKSETLHCPYRAV